MTTVDRPHPRSPGAGEELSSKDGESPVTAARKGSPTATTDGARMGLEPGRPGRVSTRTFQSQRACVEVPEVMDQGAKSETADGLAPWSGPGLAIGGTGGPRCARAVTVVARATLCAVLVGDVVDRAPLGVADVRVALRSG